MSRTLTKRERWILVVLPSVLLIVVYVLALQRMSDARLRALRTDIEAEKRRGLDPRIVALQQLETQNLKRRIDAEKTLAATLGRSGGQYAARATVAVDRTRALAKLGQIFEKHSLRLVAGRRENETQISGVLPQAFRDAWVRPAKTATASGPQVWRFELVGSYAEMLGCLEAVSELDDVVLPLSVSLEPAEPSSARRRWKLWIWI